MHPRARAHTHTHTLAHTHTHTHRLSGAGAEHRVQVFLGVHSFKYCSKIAQPVSLLHDQLSLFSNSFHCHDCKKVMLGVVMMGEPCHVKYIYKEHIRVAETQLWALPFWPSLRCCEQGWQVRQKSTLRLELNQVCDVVNKSGRSGRWVHYVLSQIKSMTFWTSLAEEYITSWAKPSLQPCEQGWQVFQNSTLRHEPTFSCS